MIRLNRMLMVLAVAMLFAQFSFAQAKKVVLIEEGTGTWCVWCPRGIVYAERILEQYPDDVIVIAVHNQDPMTDVLYNLQAGFPGFPSSHIDRQIMDIDPSAWPGRIAQQIQDEPPANISVDVEYDETTREITATVTGEFFHTLITEYRFSAILVEDAVRGTTSDYNQANAYVGGGNGEMGGYENLPHPVPASMMIYDYVGRELLGGFLGTPNSLPPTISPDETHSYTYTYTLPEDYDPEYSYIVGVLIKSATGEIENAGRSSYFNGNRNAKPFFHTSPSMVGVIGSQYEYDIHVHDPGNAHISITPTEELPEWLAFEDNGDGTASLTGAPANAGVYEIFLTASDGEWEVVQSYFIVVDEPADKDWTILGDYFPEEKMLSPDIAMSEQSQLFSANINQTGNEVIVKQYNRNKWDLIGTLENGGAQEVSLTVNETNIPFLALGSDDHVRVYQVSGGSFTQIGTDIDIAASSQLDLVYRNSNLYLSMTSAETGGVRVYGFFGDGWVQLGNDFPMSTSRARLAVTPDEDVYLVLANDDSGQMSNQVHQFDDLVWNMIGDEVDAGGSAGGHDIFVKDNDIYVSYTSLADIKPAVRKWNGTEWELVGDALSMGNTTETRLVVDDNNRVILSFVDQGLSNRMNTRVFNGLEWKNLGSTGISNMAANIGDLLLTNQGVPILGFVDKEVEQQMSIWSFGTFRPGVVSTHDIVDAEPLNLYPNPADDQIVIDAEWESQSIIRIWDQTGKMIETRNVQASKKIILDCSSWANGIYYIEAIANNNRYAGQILKN